MLHQCEITVLHYMFCHPENIEYRLQGDPIFNWQHVMRSSGIKLSVQSTNGRITNLVLTQGEKVLERPKLKTLCFNQHQKWIWFQWISPSGKSQFWVKCLSRHDSNKVASYFDTPKYKSRIINVPPVKPQVLGVRINEISKLELPSDCSVSSCTPSEVLSLADCQSMHSDSGRRILKKKPTVPTTDFEALIRNEIPLNLNAEKYSYFDMKLKTYKHYGIMSDLCVCLVPSDWNGNPIILITRNEEVLESLAPHPGYLLVKQARGVLILEEVLRGVVQRIVQVKMKNSNVAAACEWLKLWLVKVINVSRGPMVTDTTIDLSNVTSSDLSDMNRESRYWKRKELTSDVKQGPLKNGKTIR